MSTSLPAWIGPNNQGWLDDKPRWEHVFEVTTAIDETVKMATKKDRSAFDKWFLRQRRTKWKICLVTREEDAKLGKTTHNGTKLKGPDRYDAINQALDAQYLLRPAII